MLSRCRRFEAWSRQTLDAARERFSLSERDAALCERLCLAVLQNAALCDHYIGCYSSVPVPKLEPNVTDILRLGTVQLLFMDRIPVSAAVDQSVAMTKKTNRAAAGLVNAVLRRIAENRDDLPPVPGEGTAEALSVRYSHPLWLCEKLVSEKGYAFAEAFLKADNTPPELTVSVNLTTMDAVSFAKSLETAGFHARISPVSRVSVEISDAKAVHTIPGYLQGRFFVQDAAAAASVLAAAPQPGERVLDLCSAPGGKSMLCAVLMGGQGEIVSSDLHAKKLRLVEENAQRLGFGCITTCAMDASAPDRQFSEAFDLVIADVPCSGMGVIRKKPEIRYKSPDSLQSLPSVQLRILRGAAGCVRLGGRLLYSTCSVLREENDDVVKAFLDMSEDFSLVDSRTIWPQEFGTDGFYYCLLRRKP